MSQEAIITSQMRDAIGVASDPLTHDVEKGAIIKFAQAIGDPNPLFNDEQASRQTRYGGLIAPPTFLRSMAPGPMRAEVRSPYPAVLDGGSEWEYFEPVRPGDRITVTVRLVDLYEREGSLGNMLFAVRENRFVNQEGAMVAVARDTEIYSQPAAKREYRIAAPALLRGRSGGDGAPDTGEAPGPEAARHVRGRVRRLL